MKTQGTIRRWTGTWGIANVYRDGASGPERFFVHRSRLVNALDVLDFDIRISFTEGAPRRPGELPQALEIEIAPSIKKIGGAK